MSTTASHVLLWSQSQCAFHIEPVADMLRENAAAFVEDRRMDYVPIAVGSENGCHRAADHLRDSGAIDDLLILGRTASAKGHGPTTQGV